MIIDTRDEGQERMHEKSMIYVREYAMQKRRKLLIK